jgi:hypothetical protein
LRPEDINTKTFVGTRVKSLHAFRKGHVDLGRIAAKHTATIMWLLDSTAGPGGSSVDVDPEYQAFREWFAKNVSGTVLGALTTVLGSLELNLKGAVRLDRQPEVQEQSFDTAASRLRYLCREIAGLQKAWGQLFEDEISDCESDMVTALAVDMSDPQQRVEGLRLLGELETWYIYAQQGMRLFRNDADARARFDEVLERLLAEEEVNKARTEAVAAGAEGSEEERAEARVSLLLQKKAVEAEICEFQEALAERRRELEGTLAKLSRLGSGASEHPSPSPANSAASA